MDLPGHARMYLALGFALLPIHAPLQRENGLQCSCGRPDCPQPAKHPFGQLVRNGVRGASKEAGVVTGWFANASLNIAIATGAVSGIVALDVDPRHDGDESLAALEAKHGPQPATWRFLTGGGGEHILFRHPGGRITNSAGALGSGLDIRGDGGYIVAPPSRHICGRPYAISVDHHPDDVPLANMPEWLMAKISPSPRHPSGSYSIRTNWRSHIGTTHPEGRRNDAVAQLTGHLLRNRIDPLATLDLLLAWNRLHCQPPLTDDEVASTVRSIASREIKQRETTNAI